MFTGIIEEIGIIRSVARGVSSSQLTIDARKVTEDMKTGDSICTDGVCLTVIRFGPDHFIVDVMPETMRRTSIGLLKPGSGVNLERAVRLTDRLGGHLVTGHIDGTGKIIRKWNEDNAVRYSVSAEPGVLKYLIERGSVCLDGISLTVVSVDRNAFGVSLIPHTQSVTTLLNKQAGDLLNIECDIFAKYTEKLIHHPSSGGEIDLKFITDHGF
ncbi:MAG: riboflavin synthase [Bacteroidales bacterium]|nr:riboflavin synthase [Bacteroidales bacterium]